MRGGRRVGRVGRGLGLVVVSMALTACSYYKDSKNLGNEFVPVTKGASPQASGHAWVALRFPAAIDESANALLKKNWVEGINKAYGTSGPVLEGSYKELADSSMYYAAELYRKLTKYIPVKDVLLEPQYLTVKSGKLQLLPIADSKVPVVLTINFFEMPELRPGRISRGSLSVPRFNVTTSGLASPKTCGAVAATDLPLQLPAFNEANCIKLSTRQALQPKFWEYFSSNSNETLADVPVRREVPFTPNQFLVYPPLLEEFDDEHVEAAAAPTFKADERNSPNHTFELLAAAVRQGLSQYDLDKALRVERLRYVAEYDPELAKRLATLPSLNAEDAANGMSTEDRVRLHQINKLADYERDWISRNQDKPLSDAVLNGPFGKSFRSTRLAKQEAKDSQERREIIGTVLVVAGGAAAVGAAAAASSSALNAVQTAALQATSQAGLSMALNSAMSDPASAQSDFYSHFGAELAARDQVLDVTINDKVIKVNASNRVALRNELKRAYQEANAVH